MLSLQSRDLVGGVAGGAVGMKFAEKYIKEMKVMLFNGV